MSSPKLSHFAKGKRKPCPGCHDALPLDEDFESPAETIPHLERYAKNCGYCQILLSLIKEQSPETKKFSIYSDRNHRNTKGLLVMCRSEDGIAVNAHEYSVCNLVDLSEQDRIEVCASGIVNTGSDAAVAWTKEKLSVCQKEHESCNIRNEYRMLPDRVLKISDHESGSSSDDAWLEADVSLYESRGEKTDYVALSHRWGKEQPLRLLQENHADFQRGIAWSALPKTFQHAVMFARKLGVSYIWIDSLCIVQDSKEDWLHQSGKMAAIYENATITLAATVSDGSSSGMLVEPTELQKGCITNGKEKLAPNANAEDTRHLLKTSTDHDVVVFVKQKMTWGSHPFPGHFSSPELPLLTRGWVYQERLLSPRIVHFGNIDITWECNTDITCYCDTWQHSYSRDPIGHPIKPQHASCLTCRDDNQGSMSSRWIRIVEAYTEMDLTVASDRLPAIAGIAKQYRRGLHNKNYTAGLWEESILTGLLWARKDGQPPAARAEALAAAPSWSWLSVPGKVHYPHSRYVGAVPFGAPELKNISFRRGEDEEFTTLWGGSITLRGKMLTGVTRVVQGTNWQGNEESHHEVFLPGKEEGYKAWLDYGSYEEDHREQVSCLFMGRLMEDGAISLLFLLLKAVFGMEGVYVRVGLGRASIDDKLFEDVEEVRDVMIV